MLIFNCTQAATRFFSRIRKDTTHFPLETSLGAACADSIHQPIIPHEQAPTLSRWRIHAVRVHRRHCLIAMELNSRYCMTFADVRKGDSETFVSLFITRLLNNMQWYGQDLALLDESSFQPITSRFLARHGKCRFVVSTDRSTQTHINNVVRQLRNQADYAGCLPDNQTQAAYFDLRINDQRRRTKAHADGFYPCQLMFCHWLNEYCGANQAQVEQAAALFQTLRLHGGDQPPGIRVRDIAQPDATDMPDKVVSLAAQRRHKQ